MTQTRSFLGLYRGAKITSLPERGQYATVPRIMAISSGVYGDRRVFSSAYYLLAEKEVLTGLITTPTRGATNAGLD
jgi:hypothetical protein